MRSWMRLEPGSAGCGCCPPGWWCTSCSRWRCSSVARTRAVWGKLTAGLEGLAVAQPGASSLARARRRVGAAPLRRLFETLAGPVARAGQPGAFYRGLRTVAVDGTFLHVPDDE